MAGPGRADGALGLIPLARLWVRQLADNGGKESQSLLADEGASCEISYVSNGKPSDLMETAAQFASASTGPVLSHINALDFGGWGADPEHRRDVHKIPADQGQL